MNNEICRDFFSYELFSSLRSLATDSMQLHNLNYRIIFLLSVENARRPGTLTKTIKTSPHDWQFSILSKHYFRTPKQNFRTPLVMQDLIHVYFKMTKKGVEGTFGI